MKSTILLVEDDPQQRELLIQILSAEPYQILAADSVESAILLLKEHRDIQLVFSDWKLGARTAMPLLQYVRQHLPELGFVVATAYGSISHAVEAIQAGADDYLSKPFKRQELLLAIEKALRASALRLQNRRLTASLSEQQQLVDLVGKAPCMQQLFERISRISPTQATVLITGESGTGKELAARALHQLSPRQQGPFMALNCGAIPEHLAEAELFGAEKGAYTGASQSKAGKFEAAQGGTIFLDEIAELPLNLQAKLLRLLQEGTVTRLGSHQEIALDIRVVAATHQNLVKAVEEGRFREDLYYRLNVVPIRMPALRERAEDIPQLIRHFLRLHQQRYQLQVPELSKTVLRQLMDYHWPGNVRELSNRLERFVLLGDEQELVQDLRSKANSAVLAGGAFRLPEQGMAFDALEQQCLQQALALAEGNKTKAAKLLDMPYKAFLYRLEKFNLVP